jgi:hypothetical protein
MLSVRVSLISCAFALLLSGCASKIPNLRGCSVAGRLVDGVDCASTLEDGTWSLTLTQVIEMLEPRECVPVPGMNLCDPLGEGPVVLLPKRAGAVLFAAEDVQEIKTFIEETCRKMKCKPEVVQAVERIARIRAPLP